MCRKKEFRFTCGCVHKNTIRMCDSKKNGKRCLGTTTLQSSKLDHGCQGHQCPRCYSGLKQYDESICDNCKSEETE